MSETDKYSFLRIYHEEEGVARGAHLVEKINRAIYTLIQKQSTPEAARTNQLYFIGMEIPDVMNLDRKTTGHILDRLIKDKVITQIFRLDYLSENNEIQIVPCFIAHEAESGDQLNLIFSETLMRSVTAIEMMLSALPVCNREGIKKDMLIDIESIETPNIKDLSSTLVEPLKVVHASKFDVLPLPNMMLNTVADIEQELMKRNKLIDVLNYGFMHYREKELLDRIETAIEILNENLLLAHIKKPGLKKNLDNIDIEESTYNLDEKSEATATFQMKRAEALKKSMLDDPTKDFTGTRFPGSLVVETLISLGDRAGSLLQKRQKFKNLENYEAIKQTLMNSGEDAKSTMLVFTQEERLRVPEVSWRSLVDDLDLYYRTWELHDGTRHVFIRREDSAFIVLIRNLGYLIGDERWKILAMKTILEENEKEMPELFSNREMIPVYGQLLRGVYMNYIPFLYRFLMMFGLGFAKDAGFRIAKERIELEQKVLKGKNQEISKEVQINLEKKKLEAKESLEIQSFANEIIEQLNWFYFDRILIPSVGDIQSTLQDMALKDFEKTMQKANFQLLSIPDASSENDKVLIHPVYSGWRSQMIRISKTVENILQTPEISVANPVQYNRARALKKYLAKADNKAETKEKNNDDPYEEFGKEVDKVKKNDAKAENKNDDDFELEL